MFLQETKLHTVSKALHKHGRLLLMAALLAAGILIIVLFSILSYTGYQKELVSTEQVQLLGMARTIGQSLTNYMELEQEDIRFLCQLLESYPAPADRVTALEEFATRNQGLYNWIGLYSRDGRWISHIGIAVSDTMPLPQGDIPAAKILGKDIEQSGWYEIYVAQSVVLDGEDAYFVGAIDLNHIYEATVRRVKIGEGGYSVVKDKQLSIIMHHAKSQIGMEAVYDRSVQYPQLDLSDLTRWIAMQRNAPEGTSILHSFVWDSPDLTPITRVVAYTTIDVLGDQWIVNSTLPYEELNAPLRTMIERLAMMGGGMVVLLIVIGIFLNRHLIRMETQRKEITYLRRINEGMELLRSKENELRHYRRVQSLGEMSSQIAHEFNNYLTPIMVFGEILDSDEALSEENREYTKEILKSAERGAALSRQLLDFSRQDVGIQMKSLCLTEEVRRASEMIAQLAPKRVNFRCELPEETFFYMGREGEMEQLLMNLGSNAFHAMEECSHGSLTVRLRRLEDTAGLPQSHMGWAELLVSDTGCGIAPEALEKIFDPFFTTKRKGKGTGLGLPVVKNAVAASGGQIDVESRLGQGTTFRMLFPLCEEGALPGGSHFPAKISRMAVVDDDAAILRALETDLKQRRIKADTYANPMEILSVVQNNPARYDLILLDRDMPEMDGVEAARLLRSLTRDVCLVMMSGRETADVQTLLQTSVLDRFVPKAEMREFLENLKQ